MKIFILPFFISRSLLAHACKLFLLFLCSLPSVTVHGQDNKPTETGSQLVWDKAPHNAFTDLVRYQNKFYLTFRESAHHVPRSHAEDGKIRILESKDGKKWKSLALVELEGYDLRDPNLSVTPDGKLLLLMGGSLYENGKLQGMKNHVAFLNKKGITFSVPVPITVDPQLANHDNWLWHLAWQGTEGYGVIYQRRHSNPGWKQFLMKTTDGLHYSLVTELSNDSQANETALAFLPDGTLTLAMRRDPANRKAEKPMGLFATSPPPYTHWQWQESNIRLGGPELQLLPSAKLLLGTRAFAAEDGKPYTGIFEPGQEGKFNPLFRLPSGGDNSYPGMVLHNNHLLISYYSSHEGKSSIYLAKIPLSSLP